MVRVLLQVLASVAQALLQVLAAMAKMVRNVRRDKQQQHRDKQDCVVRLVLTGRDRGRGKCVSVSYHGR